MTKFITIIGTLLIYWALHMFFSGYLDQKKINKYMFCLGAIVYVEIFIARKSNVNFWINFTQSYMINLLFAIVFYNGMLFKKTVFAVIFQFIGLMADLFVGGGCNCGNIRKSN